MDMEDFRKQLFREREENRPTATPSEWGALEAYRSFQEQVGAANGRYWYTWQEDRAAFSAACDSLAIPIPPEGWLGSLVAWGEECCPMSEAARRALPAERWEARDRAARERREGASAAACRGRSGWGGGE